LKSLSRQEIKDEFKDMGPVIFEEKVLMASFTVLALLWFFRVDMDLGTVKIPGWDRLFPYPAYFNDGPVAILVALVLFLIPSKQRKGEFLMDWKAAEDIPWEIILLFGGGFALASGFKESGLSAWFGEQMEWLRNVHPLIIIFSITFMVSFLTEVTSNTATVETLLPIMAGLAISIEQNPLLFMLPATIAGSMAFMLPVATPPNAIVFGTRRLKVYQMAKTGFIINMIGVVIVTLATYYLGTFIFGIENGVFPEWAKGVH
jgi:sodium-dependent dicarboxylate transporter 2/3/5